jgi:hypothetical protein
MMTDERYVALTEQFLREGDCPCCGAIEVPVEGYADRVTLVHDRFCELVAEFRRREEP